MSSVGSALSGQSVFSTSKTRASSASTTNANKDTFENVLQTLFEQLSSTTNSSTTGNEAVTGKQTSVGDTTTTALDDATRAQATSLLNELIPALTGSFSSDNSLDFEAIRKGAVQNVIDLGLADVVGQNAAAGTYKNTAVAQAAERLGARATIQGAEAEANARLASSQLDQKNTETMANVLNNILATLKGSVTETQAKNTNINDQNTARSEQATTAEQSSRSGINTTDATTKERSTSTTVASGTSRTSAQEHTIGAKMNADVSMSDIMSFLGG